MKEIEVHGGDYDHVRGIGGEYQGIRLAYRAVPVRQVFVDMLATRRYPACEFSAANYLLLRATGQHWLSAIPVFPYRAFRHSLVVVRDDSTLASLSELAGKRVGVDDYSMTAAVWVRGLLRSEYGVEHPAITWVTPRRQRFPIAAGARVELVDTEQPGGTLEQRLAAGSIDAMLGFSLEDSKRPPSERRLRTLLPDPQVAERDYYRRTGLFPIHHCVVVRNDVAGELPQLPQALMAAYSTAKAHAIARRCESLLPWRPADWERDMAFFGGDPLPYGWNEVNRRAIATLAGYLHEQGFIDALPDVDALFLPVDAR
jgi:4,5-dihydroxyphthalate decarboxylase